MSSLAARKARKCLFLLATKTESEQGLAQTVGRALLATGIGAQLTRLHSKHGKESAKAGFAALTVQLSILLQIGIRPTRPEDSLTAHLRSPQRE